MLDKNDFSMKQIVLIFCNNGEKLSFKNDNLIVKDNDNKMRLQVTCYRIFSVFVIGNTTITSGLIQRAKKFNFSIALFTVNFRLYDIIACPDRGNTLLHKKQYAYQGLSVARIIVDNKIQNQQLLLKTVRNKSDYLKDALEKMNSYRENLLNAESLFELMGYEGLSSKLYFKSWFNNVLWTGRKPRVKNAMTNSILDIGYTILFSFIEALLNIYGFDLYVGVLHREFYMRKSLVCDLVEPFRPIIDRRVKTIINLNEVTEKDFLIRNNQYQLKWESSPKIVAEFLKAIMDYKLEIFVYIQSYYRSFLREKMENTPRFLLTGG